MIVCAIMKKNKHLSMVATCDIYKIKIGYLDMVTMCFYQKE